jgi:hypothetical protein
MIKNQEHLYENDIFGYYYSNMQYDESELIQLSFFLPVLQLGVFLTFLLIPKQACLAVISTRIREEISTGSSILEKSLETTLVLDLVSIPKTFVEQVGIENSSEIFQKIIQPTIEPSIHPVFTKNSLLKLIKVKGGSFFSTAKQMLPNHIYEVLTSLALFCISTLLFAQKLPQFQNIDFPFVGYKPSRWKRIKKFFSNRDVQILLGGLLFLILFRMFQRGQPLPLLFESMKENQRHANKKVAEADRKMEMCDNQKTKLNETVNQLDKELLVSKMQERVTSNKLAECVNDLKSCKTDELTCYSNGKQQAYMETQTIVDNLPSGSNKETMKEILSTNQQQMILHTQEEKIHTHQRIHDKFQVTLNGRVPGWRERLFGR